MQTILIFVLLFGQVSADFTRRPDPKVWGISEAHDSAIVPHSHWWKMFSNDDWGVVRYDYPEYITEYGVPGCQAWDMSSFQGRGPIYFEHVLHRDYIEMRAPSEHLIEWTCRGMMAKLPMQRPGLVPLVPKP